MCMKSLIKPLLFSLMLAIAFNAIAQDEKPDAPGKKQKDIIIRKKGDSKEKTTIVIDGDKVTINGKPAEDYKDDDVEIMKDDDFLMAPMPSGDFAFAPNGGFNVMGDDFMREIHSNKAFLGVMTKKVPDGAQVTEVTKESAAEKAGLKEGDIITKVNDSKIEDADDLYQTIGKYKPDDKVTITYKRGGKENKIDIKLGENKQVKVFSWNNGDMDGKDFKFNYRQSPHAENWGNGYSFNWNNKPRLGLQVQETEDSKGVKVLDVDEDEPAGKAGIKEDDIITAINSKTITSLDILKDAMKDVKDGDSLKFDILRDGKAQTINVKFPKELKTTDL